MILKANRQFRTWPVCSKTCRVCVAYSGFRTDLPRAREALWASTKVVSTATNDYLSDIKSRAVRRSVGRGSTDEVF